MTPESVAKPTAPTRKGRRTRQRLLAAGREVLEERGYFDSTVAEIAARGGVALGGFYHYFPNKDQLFLLLLENLVEELYSSTSGAWDKRKQPLDNLRESTRRYLVAYYENRDLISALLGMAASVPECAHLWWSLRERTYRRMEGYLRAAPAVSPERARHFATALGVMVENYAYHWFIEAPQLDREPVSIEAAADLLSTIWYRAVYWTGA